MHRTTRLERTPQRSKEIEDKPILGDGPAGTLNASEGHFCLPTEEKSFVSIDVHMIRELMTLPCQGAGGRPMMAPTILKDGRDDSVSVRRKSWLRGLGRHESR